MAGPFDDQLVVDMLETVKLGTLGGSSSDISDCSVDEIGVQTVQAGLLSLVSRDYQITMGLTQCPTRPAEGATVTFTGGLTAVIFSVLYRKLANFWELGVRNFSVPGGLTERGFLSRRNSSLADTKGLNDPTWANLESNVPCRTMQDSENVERGEIAVGTLIIAHVMMQGFREFRAGDRFNTAAAPTVFWDVEGAETYDPSLGVQQIRLARRV